MRHKQCHLLDLKNFFNHFFEQLNFTVFYRCIYIHTKDLHRLPTPFMLGIYLFLSFRKLWFYEILGSTIIGSLQRTYESYPA
jgi:hypothetical protein